MSGFGDKIWEKIKENYMDLKLPIEQNTIWKFILYWCKYRKKLLVKEMNTFIKNIIYEIESKSDFNIIEMQSDIDHIHIMIQYIPKS